MNGEKDVNGLNLVLLRFWQKKRDEGQLMMAVQLYGDRAILFFGAYAVFAKDEQELVGILEAYEIAMASDEDLLKGFAPAGVAASLRTEAFAGTDELVDKVSSRFTKGYVAAVRKLAREKLQHALGHGFNEA